MPQKSSHKLWTAENNNGKVVIKRMEAEKDEFDPNEFSKAVVASVWGIYGANLYDEMLDLGEIKEALKPRFASVMKELKASGEEPPKVLSWEELRQAFGTNVINDIRGFVANGIKVRRTSRALNLPFIAAADLVDDFEIAGVKAMKDIINKIRNGQEKRAVKQYGKLASKVASLYEEAKTMPKFSVDQAAKDYWESYYGDFGKQLVKEVKKRIKADIAYEWMLKNGVDEAAAKYWENYYSETDYGKKMVAPKEKVVKPSDKKKKKEAANFASPELELLARKLLEHNSGMNSFIAKAIIIMSEGKTPSVEILRGVVKELNDAELEDMHEEDIDYEEAFDDDEDIPMTDIDELIFQIEEMISSQVSKDE